MFFVCLFFVFVFHLNIHNYNLQTQWLGASVQRSQALLNGEGAAGRVPPQVGGPRQLPTFALMVRPRLLAHRHRPYKVLRGLMTVSRPRRTAWSWRTARGAWAWQSAEVTLKSV